MINEGITICCNNCGTVIKLYDGCTFRIEHDIKLVTMYAGSTLKFSCTCGNDIKVDGLTYSYDKIKG